VIISFKDQTTADIFNGIDSKLARKISKNLWSLVSRKFDMLNAARDIRDLLAPPGNRLEALKGNMEGLHSIRINDQFRIVFKWLNGNAQDVRIDDYH
jgi:proteic killer suppression protein